jgi:hypothetical protein
VDSSESICPDSFFQFDYYGGEDEAEIEVEEEEEIEEEEIEEEEEVVPVENEEAVAGSSKPKEILKKEAKRRTYKERERMRREEEKKKVTDDVNSLAKTFDEQCSSGKHSMVCVISTKFFIISCLILQMRMIRQQI